MASDDEVPCRFEMICGFFKDRFCVIYLIPQNSTPSCVSGPQDAKKAADGMAAASGFSSTMG
jgi:hypothetical protein